MHILSRILNSSIISHIRLQALAAVITFTNKRDTLVRKHASIRLMPACVEVIVGVNNRSSTMFLVTCKRVNLLNYTRTHAHLLLSMEIQYGVSY